MKNVLLILIIAVFYSHYVSGQGNAIIPDLSKVTNKSVWEVNNREIAFEKAVHMNVQPGDGLLWLKDFEFQNGRIELELKGMDKPGQSFVGVAFHVLNDSTFDAVYFRAFNFKNPERNSHSVQYISHPVYTWSKLREEHPGKYENVINPVPDPDDWFKATIEVNFPSVKVYVNDSNLPTLEVEQISSTGKGSVGFWVGNYSEGSFRNLKITPR